MNKYPKTIVVNSPPGSGGIFCRELIRNNLKAEIVWPWHDLNGFQQDDINICIIRNPYDVLASGIEVGFTSIPDEIRDFHNNDEDAMLSDQVVWHLYHYHKFLKLAQTEEYITPVSFQFLTEEPEKFLSFISNKFDVDFKESRMSAEEVKNKIKEEVEHMTRAPREKTDFRKKIDEIVKNHDPVKHAYEKYLLLTDILQSTENML